jgi:hypothetical protein
VNAEEMLELATKESNRVSRAFYGLNRGSISEIPARFLMKNSPDVVMRIAMSLKLKV